MTEIPLFPLGNVLFPDGILPLQIFEVRYLHLIKRCVSEGKPFGVVPLLQGREVRVPEATEVLAEVGCLAHIETADSVMPGLMQIRCRGGARFRLQSSAVGEFGLWMGQVQYLPTEPVQAVPTELQRCVELLDRAIAEQSAQGGNPAWLAQPYHLNEAAWVANRLAEILPLGVPAKTLLLGMNDPGQRLAWIDRWLEDSGVWNSFGRQ